MFQTDIHFNDICVDQCPYFTRKDDPTEYMILYICVLLGITLVYGVASENLELDSYHSYPNAPLIKMPTGKFDKPDSAWHEGVYKTFNTNPQVPYTCATA